MGSAFVSNIAITSYNNKIDICRRKLYVLRNLYDELILFYRYKQWTSTQKSLTLFGWVRGSSGPVEISENWPKHIDSDNFRSIPLAWWKVRVKYILSLFFFHDLSWSTPVMELSGLPLSKNFHCASVVTSPQWSNC